MGQTYKTQKNTDHEEYKINHRKRQEGMERRINNESVRNLGISPISPSYHQRKFKVSSACQVLGKVFSGIEEHTHTHPHL